MKIILSLLSILLLSQTISLGSKAPNVLFLLANDQAFQTISAHGNRGVTTPNLDRLVASGTTFSNAYNMGSWQNDVSQASRTMMFSGRFLWHASKRGTEGEKHPILTTVFRDAGYDTYGTGKWHLTENGAMQKAFTRVINPRPGNLLLAKQDRSKFTPWNKDYGGFWKGESHVTTITGNSAISLLKTATSAEKPFFLYVGFNAPHTTWQYEAKERSKIKAERLSIPPNVKGNHFYIKNAWPKVIDDSFVSRRYLDYYAMVSLLDYQVGRILDALEKSGKKDETLIVFLSDNGLNSGENGIIGRRHLYETTLRAPLIIAGPGVPKNKFNDRLVYLQDVIPTLLNLSGIPKPTFCQFRSFLPNSKGWAEPPWEDLLGAYRYEIRSIRVNDSKLVLYRREGERHARLYDLLNDPFEMNDILHKSSSRELVDDCLSRLQRWETFSGGSLLVRKYFAQPGIK